MDSLGFIIVYYLIFMTEVRAKSQFPEMEEEVLNFWKKNKIFEASCAEATAGQALKPNYVFYDGPPFATGTPHYGHIVASLMKDVVPRYWTMNGYRVERKWGWDCHGLPIENIVEKELGSKSKKDIEAYGVAKFNEACRARVLSYVDEWRQTINRLGRWVDFDNAYKTMDLAYMESIWWVFKQLWDKGLIYEGYRSMHICPRCETTLSQSEVAEGYQDIKDLSATVKFKLDRDSSTNTNFYKDTNTDADIYILAWTTTPWTLIGNVALAVGEEVDYVLVSYKEIDKNQELTDSTSRHSREGGNPGLLVLAKDRIADALKDFDYKIIKEFKGSDLVNLKYQSLFNYYSSQENLENKANGWQIYSADFVNTEEGTGVVHIAPAFGEDDLNLGKAKNLPFVQHVGMDGLIKEEVKGFAGMNVKEIGKHTKTDKIIINYLKEKELLFDSRPFEHSYPHCWRCDTPLLNYATSSYFVKVSEIKEQAVETAVDINWSPEHIKDGRFGQWLTGARDWSISRQRFWASVLPIWQCECGEKQVVGSVQELKELSGQTVTDLHKHVVDAVTFVCPKCGQEMHRVSDVLDTWFDSGSMPYAQMHYPFDNKEKFEANFPAQFIAEGVDQTRAWFYYLHIIANGIFQKPAFKNVVVNGIVLAEDGKKMSKKLQNYPDPNEVLNHYGADALRAYLLTSPVMQAENLNFSAKGVEESLRKNIMLLWNVYKFYETYASSLSSRGVNDNERRGDLEIATSSAVARNNSNVLDIWIVSKLNQLIKETTEAMRNYNLPKAVRPITVFIDEFSTWYLRRSRDRFKTETPDKQEALATSKFVLLELSKVMAPFMPFMAETIWQKVSGYDFADKNKSVHLLSWSQAGVIDESVIANMEVARKAVELALAKRDEAGIKVRQPLPDLMIKNCSLESAYLEIIKEEVNVKEASCQFGEGDLLIELNTKISDELAVEGLKRELVRSINALRKKAGLTINDKVEIFIDTADNQIFKSMMALYGSEILAETIGLKLNDESLPSELIIKDKVNINGHQINLGLK